VEPIQLAAVLALTVVVASVISVELGLSVALVELALGVVLGNVFGLDANADWLGFVASFASIVLTFLAGAEVDPDDFRERFGAALAISLVSFAGPFVVAALAAYGLLAWTPKASLITGTALSTTSLAVVYAVLVETGLNTMRVGKLIMSACFVTGSHPRSRLNALPRASSVRPHRRASVNQRETRSPLTSRHDRSRRHPPPAAGPTGTTHRPPVRAPDAR
jgi:Kef-type K+ transport system membrane component KefB